MGRLMALDLGKKRCGVAVTDTLQIIANGLPTIETPKLEAFLKDYTSKETVDAFIIGNPTTLRGEPSESWNYIAPLVTMIKKNFPDITIEMVDERFTSTLAQRAMIDGGMRQSQRRVKGNADMIAASIILNDYLENRKNKLL